MNFTGLRASDMLTQSNIPNLTNIYAEIESIHEKGNGNKLEFYAVAGAVSECVEIANKPEERKCAAHILSLMNQMSLTTNQKKRSEHLQKFSNKFSECDQFVPGFICNKNN